MSRGAEERIADILEAIDRCERYRRQFSNPDPDVAQMAIDAALRNIEVIGEAANHLPGEITSAHPEIEWRAVIGMRNNLIHQYWASDISILVEVLEKDLAPLAEALRQHDAR